MGQRAPRFEEDAVDVGAPTAPPPSTQLVDDVSHEVRASLRCLLGWCKVLREGKPDAERRRRALAAIEESAAAIAGLLDEAVELRAQRGTSPAPGGETAPSPGRASGPRRGRVARPLEGVRVLVVDDETDARDLAAMVLTQAGAEVREASSATEALRLLARHRPDVVVSDIGMPGQDGHSLIRTIRDLPSPLGSIRAMAVTAFARSEDRHRSLDAGFDMHVVKPVDPTNLVGSVARLVGRDPTVAA